MVKNKVIDEKKAYEFLKEAVKGIGHTGREFFEHLKETDALLRSWGLPQEVYLAGSFHSIYGTEFMDVPKTFNRATIKKLIGDYSERLVHLFCTLRPRALSIISPDTKLLDKERFDLACLEYANIIEQVNEEEFTEKHRQFLRKLLDIVQKYDAKVYRKMIKSAKPYYLNASENKSYGSVKFISDKYLRFLPNFLQSSEKNLIDQVTDKEIIALTYTGKKVASYCVLPVKVDHSGKIIFLKEDKREKPMSEEKDKKLISFYKKIVKRGVENILEMKKGKIERNVPFFVEIYIPRIEISPRQKNYSSVQWHKDKGFWIRKATDYTLIYEITENKEPNNWIGGELYFRRSENEKNLNPIAKINGIPNQAALVDNNYGEHILSNMDKKHKNSVIRHTLICHFFLPSDTDFIFRT